MDDIDKNDKITNEVYFDNDQKKKKKTKGKKSKFLFTKEKKNIISEENALKQIEILFDRYRIDLEEIEDQDQKDIIENAATWILKAIRLGEVEIFNENNFIKVKQIIQHRSEDGTVKELVYSELEGNDQSAMPVGKNINEYDRMYALLGSMCEMVGAGSAVRQLRASDLKTAMQLSFLFLV